MPHQRPLALYIDQPDSFRPIMAELDRRGLAYEYLDPHSHCYNPAEVATKFRLVVNGLQSTTTLPGLFFTLGYLDHLERLGVPVINGLAAFTTALSKARQLTLLESLRLAYPRSRVVNHPSRLVEAAHDLRYPVLLRKNIGGGEIRFEQPHELAKAVADNQLDFGVDHTVLVQEYTPPRGDILRIEMLGGKFHYALKHRPSKPAISREILTEWRYASLTPPREVLDACEAIVDAAGIDVGGIEYMIDNRDGRLVYDGVCTRSNFAEVASDVVGFDPVVKLVDFLEHKAKTVWGPIQRQAVHPTASVSEPTYESWDAMI